MLLLCAGASSYSGPFEFGSKVKSEDTDISRLVHSYTQMTDIDDVRLTRNYDLIPGSKVRSIDEDFSRMLTFLSDWRIVFADSYGSVVYSLDDGVYIHLEWSAREISGCTVQQYRIWNDRLPRRS
jgi:hypothetical protein